MKVSIKKNPRHVPPLGTDGIFSGCHPMNLFILDAKVHQVPVKSKHKKNITNNNVNAS
jgi:hypothetical protein